MKALRIKKIIYTTFSNILYTMYAYFAFHFKQTKTKYASPQVEYCFYFSFPPVHFLITIALNRHI